MLECQPYAEQRKLWPGSGKHILGQFDDLTIVVYQAYNREIGRYAAAHGRFGGGFSFSRMTWIKPNFLWMMYRSGWGTKENQEVTLALRIRREFFDSILGGAVASTGDQRIFDSEDDWSKALSKSNVRLQWDPDHDPSGVRVNRRAIQLGLRGDALEAFAQRELVEVIDLSEFVAEQRSVLLSAGSADLVTPSERVYEPDDAEIRHRVGLEH